MSSTSADRYRAEAKRLRAIAEASPHAELRLEFAKIAAEYERLAAQADILERNLRPRGARQH
jgi:hypothetical protein